MPTAYALNRRGRVEDPLVSSQERGWATAIHLTALGTALLGLPVLVIGPLVLWLWKRDESPFLEDHGREALNFQISLLIYAAIAFALSITIILIPIAMLMFLAIWGLGLWGLVAGSLAANRGEYYRYPMTLRLVHGTERPRPTA